MADYFLAPLIVLVVLAGWIGVQWTARRYAARHPELGAYREEGGGCGSGCLCHGDAGCLRRDKGARS